MDASLAKRILIVEDQKEKSQAIRECLAEAVPKLKLEETNTIVIAGHLLATEYGWRGVVLDLSFSRTQQSGNQIARPFLAGLEILQQLNEMRSEVPVIVATQHSSFFSTRYGDFETIDQLRRMLVKAFPSNFKELIEVDLAGVKWRRALIKASRNHFQ